MALDNPWAGGPDYVTALVNALDKVPNAYGRPPTSGGTQISVRIGDDRLTVLDELCTQSGWNRNQVINALLDKGLFMTFHQLSGTKAEEIMSRVVHALVPTFDTAAASFNLLARHNRFRLDPVPMEIGRKGRRPFEPNLVWHATLPPDHEKQIFHLGTSSAWALPLHLANIKEIRPDAIADSRDTFKNATLILNVRFIMKDGVITHESYP